MKSINLPIGLRSSVTLFCIIFFTSFGKAQNFEWIKSGGILFPDAGLFHIADVALDDLGSIYFAGKVWGSVDGDPGPGTHDLGADYFSVRNCIIKLDNGGNFIWAKGFWADVAFEDCEPLEIICDASGAVYLTGLFRGGIDFDPGDDVYNLSSADPTEFDGFIWKLDSDGGFLWAHSLGGLPDDGCNGLAIDGSDNVLIAGAFSGIADFDPGLDIHLETAIGVAEDAYLLKLNSAGEFIWVSVVEGDHASGFDHVTVDSDGDIYLAGSYTGSIDADPGIGTLTLSTDDLIPSLLIEKLNDAGELIWAKQIDGLSGIFPEDIANYEDQIYIAGYFLDTVDFDPGPDEYDLYTGSDTNTFVQKLDTDGNFIWAKNMGGTASIQPQGISIDPFGDIFIAGFFRGGSVDLDPGVEELIVANLDDTDYSDLFVQKLDSDGNLLWAEASQDSFQVALRGLDLDEFGDLYLVGDGGGITYDFDFGPDSAKIDSDHLYFIWKLNHCGEISHSFTEFACDSYTVPSGDDTYYETGTYSDTLIAASGCDSIITISLTINDEAVSLESDGVVLTAFPADDAYVWIDCNDAYSIIPGETEQTFTPIESGSYAVIVTNGDCIDTTDCFDLVGVGIQNFTKDNIFTLYPNPSSGEISFTAESAMQVRIFNQLGKLVMEIAVEKGAKQINLTGLANGVYFVTATNEHGSGNSKFVLSR
ncbi:MAG: hypothetical protein ACI8ZM_000298 [Crocinitomix sp.]|jgi:hypothetical protein